MDPVPRHLKKDYAARKSILNRCIGLVYKHNVLNRDRINRLKGNDYIRFWSLVNELKVGVWLEKQGLRIRFDPPTKAGGRGEFEVYTKDGEAFIEVKTLFGDPDMLSQEELISKLSDYLEQQELPVTIVNLLNYPHDFSNNNLESLFESIKTSLLTSFTAIGEGKSEKTIKYENEQGLAIDFVVSAESSGVIGMAYGGFIDIDNQLKCKLGMPVRGMNCRAQISARDIPSLVIICDAGNLSNLTIEGILYGTRVGTLIKGKPIVFEHREKNGKWDNDLESPLSAVGVFKWSLKEDFVPNVDIYLCPRPSFLLPKSIFSECNIRWWRLGDDRIAVIQDIDN